MLSLARHLVDEDERAGRILATLRRISEETGETVHYSVLDRDAAVLLFRAKGSQRVAVDFQIGDRSPLHCTSIGKVLLAYHRPAAVEAVIAAGLPQGRAQHHHRARGAARASCAAVRAQGYAYRRPGVRPRHALRGGAGLRERRRGARRASRSPARAAASTEQSSTVCAVSSSAMPKLCPVVSADCSEAFN